MINSYRSKGKEFFIHGNKDHKPIHRLSEDTRSKIIDLYQTKYHGGNFTHYTELLAIHESIFISPITVNKILMAEHILSTKACRLTKKRVKKELLDA